MISINNNLIFRAAALLGIALVTSSALAATALPNQADFTASDFAISVVGIDPIIPIGSGAFSGTFNVRLTNTSDRIAEFGETIFTRGGSGDVTINSVPYFNSEFFSGFDFSPLFPVGQDRFAPGESIDFGGISIGLNLDTPAGTQITLNSLSLSFSNVALGDIPPEGDPRFTLVYENVPLVTVVQTPIPAVGVSLLPMLMLLVAVKRVAAS